MVMSLQNDDLMMRQGLVGRQFQECGEFTPCIRHGCISHKQILTIHSHLCFFVVFSWSSTQFEFSSSYFLKEKTCRHEFILMHC